MRRAAIAALVAISLGLSVPSAFAGGRHRYTRHHHHDVRYRVVYHRVAGPVTIVRRVDRPVKHGLGARFIPLPVPRGLWVPPPFSPRHPF
jgi:hypothetical protein